MELQLKTLSHLSTLEAKALHKADDSVCVRQAITPRNQPQRTDAIPRCPYLRPLRIRLGTDPIADAATLACMLWGRKRHATSLYLFVHSEELAVLSDMDYVERLRKAFSHCTRRSLAQVCTLTLVSSYALARAS